MIELSTDPGARVRNGATFGIGTLINADTPTIRAALMARLTDEWSDTRGEAMLGLARRHDERVVEPLLAEIEAGLLAEVKTWPFVYQEFGWYESLLFEAATEIGDLRLYPALTRLQEVLGDYKEWPFSLLEEAVAACQPRAED